jgi:hypothetical protein
VAIGTADIAIPCGLVTTPFVPSDAYPMVAAAARALAKSLLATRLWQDRRSDFAASHAREWSAPALTIQTDVGELVPTDSVVIIDTLYPFDAQRPRWLIVDFRAMSLPMPARLS